MSEEIRKAFEADHPSRDLRLIGRDADADPHGVFEHQSGEYRDGWTEAMWQGYKSAHERYAMDGALLDRCENQARMLAKFSGQDQDRFIADIDAYREKVGR